MAGICTVVKHQKDRLANGQQVIKSADVLTDCHQGHSEYNPYIS